MCIYIYIHMKVTKTCLSSDLMVGSSFPDPPLGDSE